MITTSLMHYLFLAFTLISLDEGRRSQSFGKVPVDVNTFLSDADADSRPMQALAVLLLARNPVVAVIPSALDTSLQSSSIITSKARSGHRFGEMHPVMNIFGDIFDGDKLSKQSPPERPLIPSLIKDVPTTYALQEKLFSFSGEDFRVKDLTGHEVMQIDGANVNIAGKVIDKLGFKDDKGLKHFSVERRILAASTCYDIYSADGKELIAKIEREWMSMTPKYQFYYEGDLNPFGDFYAEGSFLDRQYTFKTAGGLETIAKVRRAPEVFRDVDGYAVDVAAGVDAAAIIAMAVVIDEDHDETDAKKESEGSEGSDGWPFR